MCVILSYFQKETAYADLTGEFPYRSSQGNQYTTVMYYYDANTVDMEPFKSRVAADKQFICKTN